MGDRERKKKGTSDRVREGWVVTQEDWDGGYKYIRCKKVWRLENGGNERRFGGGSTG